jgi:hypothetical protein
VDTKPLAKRKRRTLQIRALKLLASLMVSQVHTIPRPLDVISFVLKALVFEHSHQQTKTRL